MTENRDLYGPKSANWYSKLEAEAGINSARGYKWSLEQILQTPLNKKGEDSYAVHLSAAALHAREGANALLNARTFAIDTREVFLGLNGSGIREAYDLLDSNSYQISVYGEKRIVMEGLEQEVIVLGRIALGEAAACIESLIVSTGTLIDNLESIQESHSTVDVLARVVCRLL